LTLTLTLAETLSLSLTRTLTRTLTLTNIFFIRDLIYDVVNVAKVERGSLVVVIGTGAVGLSIIQGAVLASNSPSSSSSPYHPLPYTLPSSLPSLPSLLSF